MENINENNIPDDLNITQFNDFLTRATDAIACDPACQRERSANELREKYFNAKTNLMTAPNQLNVAAKNYYTFVEGESGYNSYLDKKLNDEASKIINDFQNNFNTQVGKITGVLDSYDGLLVNYKNIIELYNNYMNKNIELENKLKTNKSDILTNNRKSYYQDQGMDSLIYYYKWLLFFYVICVIACIFFMFRGATASLATQINGINNIGMSIYTKIILLGLLLLYPFVCLALFKSTIQTAKGVSTYLPKNVYNNL
jgi:hypothetical protein